MNDKLQKTHLHWRRTKIIATLGPATDNKKQIKKLIQSGVDVFRLNMSHSDHEQHSATFKRIRDISRQTGRHYPNGYIEPI